MLNVYNGVGEVKAVKEMRYSIGNRIRKYRENVGISQKELARRIGVTNSRVSNWEQGVNRPDADILVKLCFALSVSPSELLDVHLSDDELTAHERQLLRAYREMDSMRVAVDTLLGLNEKTK